jgi:hypothetical protein
VSELVNRYLTDLHGEYPQVEFFLRHRQARRGGDRRGPESGEYATLAAQLEVGYPPFVAMLAPRGGEYVIENLFQG